MLFGVDKLNVIVYGYSPIVGILSPPPMNVPPSYTSSRAQSLLLPPAVIANVKLSPSTPNRVIVPAVLAPTTCVATVLPFFFSANVVLVTPANPS